ncbi:exonuclease V [Lissotriton helveticus]
MADTKELAETEESEGGFSDFSDSELLLVDLPDTEPDSPAPAAAPASFLQRQRRLKGITDSTSSVQNDELKKNGDTGDALDGNLQRKRKLDDQTPMEKYNLKYLCVTDLCSQSWCEQKMVYGFELPDVQQLDAVPLITAGSSIHLARELEVHDIVSVSTTTREDSWAVKFLNLLSMIPVLQAGGRVREFPVFGEMEGIFMVGVVDELHYTAKGELELNELKTRGNPSLPGESQKKSHYFQVSMYKLMFDAMVRGKINSENLLNHLCLRSNQSLGPQVQTHAQKAGFSVSTFGDLLELTCLNLTFSDLPAIDSLKIEYCHQENSTPLGVEIVDFKEESVREQLQYYISYWKGHRDLRGVDIEDAWKCRTCCFSEICEWRTKKAEETSRKFLSKRGK